MTLSAQPRFLPTRALGTFNYYWNQPDDSHSVVRMAFAADFNSDGTDEVVFAGFAAQPLAADKFLYTRLQIFGWQGDNLVNVTSQWLPQGQDQVSGVGDLQFGDFNGDGRVDMFQAGYADMDRSMEQFVFYNRGDHFERVSLGNVAWQHAAAVRDINLDGIDDVVTVGWIGAPFVFLGSPQGIQRTEYAANAPYGAGIALGDFFGDGSVSAVITDWAGATTAADTALFRLTQTDRGVSAEFVSGLPAPILESFPYQSFHSSQKSHDIRARALDFSGDGLDDVVVFSSSWWNHSNAPSRHSAVQFLENLGSGTFRDATAERLQGYDHASAGSYAPVIRDFNADGRSDIFVSESYFEKANSTALLLGQDDGTFVDTGRRVLSDAAPSWSATTVARAPSGTWHLVWDEGRGGQGVIKTAEIDLVNYDVIDVGVENGVTRVRDLRRAPAIQAQEEDLLDLTGLAQDLDLDLWWSGDRAPGRKVDATGAVWERGNVIYVSTDRDQKAEWWARVVGVRDLDQDDFWLG